MVCIRLLQCAAVILGGVLLPAAMQATAASTDPVIGAPATGSVLDARLKRPIRVRLMSSLDAHRSSSGQEPVVSLRLTAPVRIPGFASRRSVPSDMPPGTVVIHVPLYPGAVPSTRRYTLPPFSGPDSAYTKGAWAEYMVPVDPATADTWYRQAFVRRGYGMSGYARSTTAGGRTELTATTFTSVSNTNLSIQLGYEAIDTKHTLVLYVALITITPPRPRGSYLPQDIVRVNITYRVSQLGLTTQQRAIRRVITNPAAIHRLVAIFNRLPRASDEVVPCPLTNALRATLIFVARNGRSLTVTSGLPCQRVAVAGFPPLSDANRQLEKEIAALLH